MSAILDALNSIIEFFQTIWDFIVHFVQDLIYIIESLGTLVARIPQYFRWVPSQVYTLIITAISVAVIYKVVNRD